VKPERLELTRIASVLNLFFAQSFGNDESTFKCVKASMCDVDAIEIKMLTEIKNK